MRPPCLAMASSTILRCSGGMLASCFCISAMAWFILPPLAPCIWFWISHKPGFSVWADTVLAAKASKVSSMRVDMVVFL